MTCRESWLANREFVSWQLLQFQNLLCSTKETKSKHFQCNGEASPDAHDLSRGSSFCGGPSPALLAAQWVHPGAKCPQSDPCVLIESPWGRKPMATAAALLTRDGAPPAMSPASSSGGRGQPRWHILRAQYIQLARTQISNTWQRNGINPQGSSWRWVLPCLIFCAGKIICQIAKWKIKVNRMTSNYNPLFSSWIDAMLFLIPAALTTPGFTAVSCPEGKEG